MGPVEKTVPVADRDHAIVDKMQERENQRSMVAEMLRKILMLKNTEARQMKIERSRKVGDHNPAGLKYCRKVIPVPVLEKCRLFQWVNLGERRKGSPAHG